MIMERNLLIRAITVLVLLIFLFNRACSEQLYRNERPRRQTRPGYFVAQNITLGLNSKTEEYGPWGPWTESSDCSRTCGGGVSFQTRICLNFRADGTHTCGGPSKRYFSCNIQDCPEGSRDFREEQCARFNSISFNNKFYSWIPYTKASNPCELNCRPKGESFFIRHDRKAIDGTRCYDDGSLDVCIDGVCMPVGCDMILGSNAKEDKCRECGGDGTGCKTIQGIFDSDNLQVGYNDILLIPAGATHINIKEVQPTNNYLAIRNLSGHFFLNGNWRIEFPRDLKIGGTTFYYERKSHGYLAPETLRALGPTLEPVFIVLLYQERNKGVSYEYSVPVGVSTSQPDTYSWNFGDYGECSQTCGGGQQIRPVTCTSKGSYDGVPEYLCDPQVKPENNRTCNTQPCPARWQVGDWSDCTKPCAGGTQYRLVYCQQIIESSAIILVADELCENEDGPKPEFTQQCNEDVECPQWVPGPWTTCDKSCGTGNQTREIICQPENSTDILDESECDPDTKPSTSQSCSIGPCEGVEWILSDWSGCESKCGGQMESREAFCSNEKGKVFPEEMCEKSRLPELTRPCPESPPCDAMWHTSEWSECSAKCGTGVQTRIVFCGTWDEDSVKKVGEDNCTAEKKFPTTRNCSRAPCKGTWFTGPWNRCSVPCGGGVRSRKILCFHQKNKVVANSRCDPSTKPFEKEPCSTHACDDDEIMMVGGCKDSEFGCCPDGITPAGENFEGCPKISTEESCEDSEYGCCADGTTPALGPFRKGCVLISSCNETTYGCCPDGITAAKGFDNEECPEEIDCTNSTHGCCPDGITPAEGPENEGCPEEMECLNSTFGCCPDGITPAMGPDNEECPEVIECSNTTFGCCPDGINVAGGENFTGCDLEFGVCENSTYGCCQDNMTTAAGPDFMGCDDGLPSGEDCHETTFGCCPDNMTPALGMNDEGCSDSILGFIPFDLDCNITTYGCCPDNSTVAKGLNGTGCDDIEGSGEPEECSNTLYGCCPDSLTPARGLDNEGCPECENSTFGCCPDNVTFAMGFNYEGCPEDIYCPNATFGCCPDNITAASGINFEGCEDVYLDCDNATFGCCSDNVTFALGLDGEGCEIEEIEDCTNTTFGCCPDNITVASGDNYQGCEGIVVDCVNSTYGCCDDNITLALGPDNYGCEEFDCVNTTFGCCPDNLTEALGPDGEGCDIDCSNTTFGCCPDNTTAAAGPNNEGCDLAADCANSTFGCCPDNVTSASGPNNEGCKALSPCVNSTFGCCPDNVTAALGEKKEGCEGTAECFNSVYGCCADGITTATGPNEEGCCNATSFGCCPDKKTAALGLYYLGCGCQTYPFGCCPDGITPAQGENYYKCTCEQYPYGCCQDKYTPARGPKFDGCFCNRMLYGCCPDGITPAEGRELQGCSCETSDYGCCPDGRTPAPRLDYVGCPCNTLPYGCCPDGKTPARALDYSGCPCESLPFGCCPGATIPARGPRYEGCACAATPHGCCPDSITAAAGPGFEGCPDVAVPDVGKRGDVCSFPKEAGHCNNYTVKWYFDMVYGGCSRFWYGGCDGNGNRFTTQEECERVCVTPEGVDACLLPKVEGPCKEHYSSWYYNVQGQTCETFTYSGCLGNNNRFSTRDSCEQTCIHHESLDTCEQQLLVGPCAGTFSRWYFDKHDRQCKRFIYSGCKGNDNNFKSEDECRHRCAVATERTPVDVCSLPKDEGPCQAAVLNWHYNSAAERCEQFYYGGCEGNANRFEARNDCEQVCLPSTSEEKDVCKLPQQPGNCQEFRERWYYDPDAEQCHRFYYSGCAGNENNFPTFYDCEKRCGRVVSTEAPEVDFRIDFCFMDQDSGPCTNTEIRWYYDKSDGVCKEFYYGGCKGTENRFKTRRECETKCSNAQDICQLPVVRGPCSGSFTQWYYEKNIDECHEFSFSGCQGNANRFNDKDACESHCRKTKIPIYTPVPDDFCSQEQDPGPCKGYFPQYYYDVKENVCNSFVYGGCDGNSNRFESRKDCEARCMKKVLPRVPEQPERYPESNEDVCRLPVEVGTCNEIHARWFYDPESRTCLPFVFGGCGGNKNRFKSYEICMRFCTGVKSFSTDLEPSISQPEPTSFPTCPPSNCDNLQCPFGVDEIQDIHGCSSCRCSNPCEVHNCAEGSRCAIEVYRTESGEPRPQPVCRLINKPGTCPETDASDFGDTSNLLSSQDCIDHCRIDADCSGDRKCCFNGCAHVCTDPHVRDTTTERTYTYRVPEETLPTPSPPPEEIFAIQGSEVILRCAERSTPLSALNWSKDNKPLGGDPRFRLIVDGSLQITAIAVSDQGTYICKTIDVFGTITSRAVKLIIHESLSAEIIIASPSVKSGSPLQLDCSVRGSVNGYSVDWRFQGVHVTNDGRREVLSNNTLLIRDAQTSDSGEYSCTVTDSLSTVSSATAITVEDACDDSPSFANCDLIVKAHYCSNTHYAKFCCKSCLLAGQLQSSNLPGTY